MLGPGRAFAWIGGAIALPLLAHAVLDRAVDATLTDALETATGEPVSVGDVNVSLLGGLRLEDVRLGDVASVRSVEAKLSLSGLIGGKLRTAVVVAEGPRLNLRDGGQRIRRVAKRLANLREPREQTEPQASPEAPTWPNLLVKRGYVSVEAGERGAIRIEGFAARPSASGLRLTADSSELRRTVAGAVLTIRLGRGAADFNFSSARIDRAVAASGTLVWGEMEPATGLEVSYGIEGAGVVRLLARFGGGRVGVRSDASATELSLSSVAASKLNPLLPTSRLRTGRLTANLGVRLLAERRLSVTGSVLLERVRGNVPWLLKRELDLGAELAGSGVLDWSDGHRLALSDLHARRGKAAVRLSGDLYKPGDDFASLAGSLRLAIEPIACSELTSVLPAELVGPLRGIRLRGTVAGSAKLDIGAPGSRPVELAVDLDPKACRAVADSPAANVAALRAAHEHLLPSGRRVALAQGKPGYTSLRSLPSHVPAAFVVAEDGRFYRHRGFDNRQIESSIAKDLAVGRFARGGSTISQQLAKNLYLTRERTFGRKLQEAVLAWRIESTLSKSEILERYLNIIQLSDTIYGIDAASRRWFGKSARRLSPREAAFLASLTRAPTTTTRDIALSGGLTPQMIRRVEHILRSMRSIGAIDAKTLKSARRDRLALVPVVASN